jgi:hypothetical protein
MSTWVIISWVLVGILTGINIFLFLKLKQASEQMLKMAFPNAKNMGDALSQMQGMMGNMGRMQGKGGGNPFGGMGGGRPQGGGAKGSDAQLKAAMQMLQNMQKGQGPKR